MDAFLGSTTNNRPRPSHCQGFTITLGQTTLGRTPLDEWSARRRNLLPDNTKHTPETTLRAVEFEPTIPASEWPQTRALERAVTGNGINTGEYYAKTTVGCQYWHCPAKWMQRRGGGLQLRWRTHLARGVSCTARGQHTILGHRAIRTVILGIKT